MLEGEGNQENPINQPPLVYTLADAMVKCGVSNTDIFEGESVAKRFAILQVWLADNKIKWLK